MRGERVACKPSLRPGWEGQANMLHQISRALSRQPSALTLAVKCTKPLVMSAPNGLPSPSTTHSDSTNNTQTIGKRKRANDAGELEESRLVGDNDPSSEKEKDYLQRLLLDILEVLKSYVPFGSPTASQVQIRS